MQVELDIFSGRPNPRWNLTPQETMEFLKLFQTLPESDVKTGSVIEGLGYRGIIVTEKEKSIKGYNKIFFCNELVVAQQGNKFQHFIDKGRILERWLFQTGKERLNDDLYRQLFSNFEGK